jgi:hypothetical protein
MGERIRQDVLESFPDVGPYDTAEVAPILYGSKKRTFHAWLDEQTDGPLFYKVARGKRMMTRLHISRVMNLIEGKPAKYVEPERPEPPAHVRALRLDAESTLDLINEDVCQIYVMECGGFSKVGYSANVGRRLSDMRRDPIVREINQPVRVAYIFSITGERLIEDVERSLHEILLKHHHRGEWFALSPDEVVALFNSSDALESIGVAL